MYTIYILLFILLALGSTIIGVFNRFARNRNTVKDSWSNIDVALKRRHDLIPNLVNTVKGYAKHEQETFNQVVAARNSAISAPKNDINAQIGAEKGLQQALGKLFALVEAYPELKANVNFLDLQQKLNEIEENLERMRRYYNSTVRENNIYGEGFPGVVFAGMFKYQAFDFFEAEATDRENTKVEF